MRKVTIITVLLFIISPLLAQQTIRRVLFLGNSYTFVNDLPGLIARLAHSAGDSLCHEQNTPGGYTLGWNPIAHSTDPSSLAKIAMGCWDLVIIQEQSQTPAIPALRDSCMFPASVVLYDSVKSANPCARVLFYQTWGRRFGGEQCFDNYYCSTDFADFFQMQDSVTRAYQLIADSLDAWVAPAGEAWRMSLIRYPHQVLHMNDDSHPNMKGSYLAACVFYDVIFGKRSAGLGYDAGLADTAAGFQMIADSIVFADPSLWNLWQNEPDAGFKTDISRDTLYLQNQSLNTTAWHWDFGDGTTSDLFEPVHVYALTGQYTVALTACDSCRCDTAVHNVSVVFSGSPETTGNTAGISLSVPDNEGTVHISGYRSEGVLSFIDIFGKTAGHFPINNGKTNISSLPPGFYIWIMETSAGDPVANGKLIF